MKLWHKVFIGLALGTIGGAFFPAYTEYFKPIGDIFLRSIKMVIAPLIFFVLVSGITSMNDTGALTRIGLKSTIICMFTNIFAVIFGIGIALVLEPGTNSHIDFGNI